jgi:hypothetical protein
VTRDGPLAQALLAKLEHAIAREGSAMPADAQAKRGLWQRTLDELAYAVMRASLWLLGKNY